VAPIQVPNSQLLSVHRQRPGRWARRRRGLDHPQHTAGDIGMRAYGYTPISRRAKERIGDRGRIETQKMHPMLRGALVVRRDLKLVVLPGWLF
jgi:hypothetical protein